MPELASPLDAFQTSAVADVGSLPLAAVAAAPAGRRVPQRSSLTAAQCRAAQIMVVDDEPINVKVVCKYLQGAGFQNFITITDSREAISVFYRQQPDILLLDIMMPEIGGLEILQMVRAGEKLAQIPVVILTALEDRAVKARALELGATDFLTKPVDPSELLPRVRNALAVKSYHDRLQNSAVELERQVRERTAELAMSRLEMIHCLGRAAEYRDNETGRHVVRVGRYAGIIARQLELEPYTIELIELAAPLHDLGKLGVPDSILLKAGQLDPQEFELMQRHSALGKRTLEAVPVQEWQTIQSHTIMGENILKSVHSPVLEVAGRIALTHHEKWDGSGYPLGLAGSEIPLEGRIVAVADVFDALSSKRPYKPAFPVEKCFTIMEESRGTHFDPEVLDAFFARREEIVQVKIACSDVE